MVRLLDVGGLERVVIDLTRRLDRSRFHVTVVCLNEPGPLANQVDALGIKVISLNANGLGVARTVLRLVRCLSRLSPDILHTHNPSPHIAGALAAAVLRLPVVINTKHGRNMPENRYAVLLNRVAALLSNAIVAVSCDSGQVARDIERVSRRKVRLIHNGIDLMRFSFVDRPRKSECQNAIHVARLNPVKDQKTLLEAARWVVDREPQFRLTIVGDGPLREELVNYRNRLGLESAVEFLGERSDVPTLLGGADFFVLSSVKEGLSLTLLEAMATGLPVVATDAGGNREVVAQGKTGLLVPIRLPAQLGAAILDMLRHPAATREMGRAARLTVEQQFSLDTMVRNYERLYESLFQSRH